MRRVVEGFRSLKQALAPMLRRVLRGRVLLGIGIVAVLGGAVWYALPIGRSAKPSGPTRQVAIGPPAEPGVRQMLSDPSSHSAAGGAVPGATAAGHITAASEETAQIPFDPHAAAAYLPRNDDPLGGGASAPQKAAATRFAAPAVPPPELPAVRIAAVQPSQQLREMPSAAGETDGGVVAPAVAEHAAPPASPQAIYPPEEGFLVPSLPSAPASYTPPEPGSGTGGEGALAVPGQAAWPSGPTPSSGPFEPGQASPAAAPVAPPLEPVASPPAVSTEPGRWSAPPASLPATIAPAAPTVPSAAREVTAVAAAATPGPRSWEGPQQPVVLVEKTAPDEMQVGKLAVVQLRVHCVGAVPAWDVVVTDRVPAGTQLVEARPPPQPGPQGELVWHLGTLQPQDEVSITLHLMPQQEGEIGSTAVVQYAAVASSRSICTRPLLAIEHRAPPKVLIGQTLTMGITVSNPGTGPATGVRIEEDVPEGLSHVAGSQLEYEVGVLRPGESRHLELVLRAERAGRVENVIRVVGDGNLHAEHRVQLEVIAPQLAVAVEGPRRRFLQRQATYTVQVANPGTAAAQDVELVAFLPRGMKFVQADAHGQYDPADHAVYWSLAELPPAKAGMVKLTTLPVEPGEQRLKVEGRAGLGLAAVQEQVVQVEQAAELLHTVKDLDEVIELGSETTYEIRVTNVGTKAATNVRLQVQMPPGMAALHGDGPTRASGDAAQVVFEPLPRLLPQEEVIYRVQVQGRQPGDHLVRVLLASDEWPIPVAREESTRVYQDR